MDIRELYEQLKEEHHNKKFPYRDGSGFDITTVLFHEKEEVVRVDLTDGGMMLRLDYYWIDYAGAVHKESSCTDFPGLDDIVRYREIFDNPIEHSCGQWIVCNTEI